MTAGRTVVAPASTVHLGDCVAWLRSLDEASVDAIVCDPPYNLGFMGKEWDSFRRARNPADAGRPSVHGRLSRTSPQYSSSLAFQEWMTTWALECLRVLRPGGHLVAFGGTRTVHRTACAIEDAGLEIRDQIGWVYFSGFPKSLDVSKAIDAFKLTGNTNSAAIAAAGDARPRTGRVRAGAAVRGTMGHGASLRDGYKSTYEQRDEWHETAPATPEARRWQGYGTALKPAFEPAVLARRPLEGTVVRNILAHGVGALNIDACRYAPGDPAWVGPTDGLPTQHGRSAEASAACPVYSGDLRAIAPGQSHGQTLGRWPANLYYAPKASRAERERGCDGLPSRSGADAVERAEGSAGTRNPRAGAGRTAKQVRNFHPTVKPVRLMRWLCRLVTPPGGILVDPFLGSGTTGVAAALEGFRFAGAELEAEYHAIAVARIAHALAYPEQWAATAPGANAEAEVDDWREAVERHGQLSLLGGAR